MKIKGFLAGAAAVVFAAGMAGAANLSLLSGSQYSEPSQILATVNTVIQNINFGVSGRLSAGLTATGTSLGTTVDQTLMTYTLPASQLANPGDTIKVVCWGTTAANSNVKTAKLNFGTSQIVTSSTSGSPNAAKWRLELVVMRSGAATQTVMGNGQILASPISIYTNAGTDSLAASVAITCQGNTPTAPQDLTAQGMLVEQIK